VTARPIPKPNRAQAIRVIRLAGKRIIGLRVYAIIKMRIQIGFPATKL